MKAIHTIASSDDDIRVIDVLNERQFSVTRLAATDGFLKKGDSTLLIGTGEERVSEAIELIKNACDKRQKITCNVPAPGVVSISIGYMITPMTVELGGATIFVVDIKCFEKI